MIKREARGREKFGRLAFPTRQIGYAASNRAIYKTADAGQTWNLAKGDMRKAMGGTYVENVRRSFLPELISMNCMMAGMAPTMVLLMMSRDMRAMWPAEPFFWMVMSIGVIAGYTLGTRAVRAELDKKRKRMKE